MSREIKFRGKDIHTGRWVYGDLLHIGNSVAIHVARDKMCRFFIIDPDTIGEMAPVFYDANNRPIYEGDIVEYHWVDPYDADALGGVVTLCCGLWAANNDKLQEAYDLYRESGYWEIIGNRWDNPELLAGGADDEHIERR